MPLKLDVQKVLTGKSDRVKSVDIHPKEPWILSALYTGNVLIWNYETQTVVRTFEISEVPVRSAKFIARKNWFVCGCDDMHIRIYNYNTCEKVQDFEAHSDYIRSIVVHPTLPYIFSGSDDMSIKLWDWENKFTNAMIFEGHTHYIMQVEINPKDTNSFASASLDRTIKVWGINSSVPHFQLEGHEQGVNCISYYQGGDRPLLVSGADDFVAKVWDYQTKTCIATLEGHTSNISCVLFHPQLPIIISGSEDGSIKIFHSHTYRLETTLQYGMERVWGMGAMPTSNKIAIGFDQGTVMLKLGQEEPVVSMDASGKIIWARNHEIQFVNVLRIGKQKLIDGEILPVAPDDLGSVEFYPSALQHNKTGQLVTVCGDGEFTIYTALKLKNKSFGQALDFVWSDRHDVYAIREASSKIKIFHDFKEFKTVKISSSSTMIFGGHLLGVRSNEYIDFYDWNDGRIIRRIEVVPKSVYWAESGLFVALVCEDNYYVLLYNEEYVSKCLNNPSIEVDEQGYENAFELISDTNDSITSAQFCGDIFIYTNASSRLNYYVGGQIITLTHLDKTYYILGYLQKENRVYLIDKRYNIVSYELLRTILAYQASIVRGDFETANNILSSGKIPQEHYNQIAHFLEKQGKKDLALQISQDPEHQFELALQLKKLDLAKELLLKSPSIQKWRQLGDLALMECDFKTVEECAINGEDLSLLLLLYSSTNNQQGLYDLSQLALKKSRYDIAFNVLYMLGRIEECIDLLNKTNRLPEAAFMARAYCPQYVDTLQSKWKQTLMSISPAAANSLGDRTSHPSHFPTTSYKQINQINEISIMDEKKNNMDDNHTNNINNNDDEVDVINSNTNGNATVNNNKTPTAQTTQASHNENKNDQEALNAEDNISIPSDVDNNALENEVGNDNGDIDDFNEM